MALLQPPFAQPDPRFQLVVVDATFTDDEEEVLLISLAGLALDIPVVLSEHLVLVLALLVIGDLFDEVLLPLGHRIFRREEVGHELFSRLVHDAPDHGLGHHLVLLLAASASLRSRRHTRGGRLGRRVGVEDDLGAGELPHLVVREDRHDLDRVDAFLGIMLRYVQFSVVERLLDGGDLPLPVHDELPIGAHFLPDGEAHLRFDLLYGGRLVARLLRGDVVRLAHPGEHFGVLLAPLDVRLGIEVVLQQPLVLGVEAGRDSLPKLVLKTEHLTFIRL